MNKLRIIWLAGVVTAALSAYSQLTYTISNNEVTITGYSGDLSGHLDIPSTLGGYPVTAIAGGTLTFRDDLTSMNIANTVRSIGSDAFYGCDNMTNVTLGNSICTIDSLAFRFCNSLPVVTIPSSVTSIGFSAFSECRGMTSIFFCGNAPFADAGSFEFAPATVYYRYCSTGWPAEGQTWREMTTALWRATISRVTSSVGGCRIHFAGPPGDTAVVERGSTLFVGDWTPVETNTLLSGDSEFLDPDYYAYTARYYRVILDYD